MLRDWLHQLMPPLEVRQLLLRRSVAPPCLRTHTTLRHFSYSIAPTDSANELNI